MMNKYQRALDDLDDGFHNLNNNDVDKIVSVFKELVDKATPKKAYLKENTITNLPMEMCSTCNDNIKYGNNYCSECGQAMDWNEND